MLKKKIQESLRKIKPVIVKSAKERDEALNKQLTQVMNDLKPLVAHINNITAQKNYQIDTPESYAKTKALCKDW